MLKSLEEQARSYATRAHAEAGQRRNILTSPISFIPLPLQNWFVA